MRTLLRDFGIGLTGNIATGKSTVATLIRNQGHIVIDADSLARDVVAPGSDGLSQIVTTFGEGMLDDKGSLNREKLGAIVFANAALRQSLNQIMHPRIDAALHEELVRLGLGKTPQPWFYEASLIIERSRQREFREIWLTVCSAQTQLQRLMERSSLSETEARRRISSQMSMEQKKTIAQVVIDTECSRTELGTKVNQLLQQRLAFATPP